jgi:hypothetical protein|tara:strand:+ start:1144 stop:1665 length:522 start_codon:yes stop_codon:yes gene_type:complete
MADTFRAAVSMTPIVTIIADADADAVDAIHHDIKGTLGGKLEWNTGQQTNTARWYYSASTTVTTTHGDLIGGFSSVGTYTDGQAIATSDDVRVVYIEHLGVDNVGNASASNDYLFIYLDGGSAANADAICLEPNESIVLKFKLATGVDISKLHGDMSANTARVKIAALCDDGG